MPPAHCFSLPPFTMNRKRALHTLPHARCHSADAVGLVFWGLALTLYPELCASPASDRDALCAPEALDIYLPLLSKPFPGATAIAQLHGTLLRTQAQRAAVTSWTPSPVTTEKTTRSRRGREKRSRRRCLSYPPLLNGWSICWMHPGRMLRCVPAPIYYAVFVYLGCRWTNPHFIPSSRSLKETSRLQDICAEVVRKSPHIYSNYHITSCRSASFEYDYFF